MTDAQLTRLIDALDRIAAALESFSLAGRSGEISGDISASGVTPKPPIKVTAPRRQVTSKTTLSRRK